MNILRTLTPLALLIALGCGRAGAPEPVVLPIAQVRLATGGPGQAEGWIAATLSATQHAVLSTRIAASIKRVHVTEGQRVAAGALLVSLADEDLQGALKAAQAGLAAAQTQERRIQALLKQNAAIPAEQDQAETHLAQAQAALAQVQANLGYTRIRAPFAGVIQSRMVSEGAFAGPGTPLVEMEGQSALELVGSVSETEAKGLRIGLEVPFQADGAEGRAVVTALATGADPVSHRGTLRARILKGGQTLRSGAFARLRLPGHGDGGVDLAVPRSALVLRGELSGVFVARDGHAELHWLALGEAQGDRLPVRAGLTREDRVIDQPGSLRDGQPIEVLR
jgi:RND family efflux transporter MFP subunit